MTPNMMTPCIDPEQRLVYTDVLALRVALARYRRFIRTKSRQCARGERDLADDLAQLARVELWRRDPSRYTPEDDDFVQMVLQNVIRHSGRDLRARELIPVVRGVTHLTAEAAAEAPVMPNLWRPPVPDDEAGMRASRPESVP